MWQNMELSKLWMTLALVPDSNRRHSRIHSVECQPSNPHHQLEAVSSHNSSIVPFSSNSSNTNSSSHPWVVSVAHPDNNRHPSKINGKPLSVDSSPNNNLSSNPSNQWASVVPHLLVELLPSSRLICSQEWTHHSSTMAELVKCHSNNSSPWTTTWTWTTMEQLALEVSKVPLQWEVSHHKPNIMVDWSTCQLRAHQPRVAKVSRRRFSRFKFWMTLITLWLIYIWTAMGFGGVSNNMNP